MIEDGAQTEITSFLIANDSKVIGVPILIEKKGIQLYDRAEVPAESTEPGDSLHKIDGVADPFFNRLQLSYCLCHTYALIGSMQPFQWDQCLSMLPEVTAGASRHYFQLCLDLDWLIENKVVQ